MTQPQAPGETQIGPQSSIDSVRAGLRETGSLAIGSLIFGLLFGSAALAAGLSEAEAIFMSIWVFAGGVQFAALALWQDPLPFLAIAVSSLLIASRHILLGLSLAPRLVTPGERPPYAALYLLTDVNAILTLKRPGSGRELPFFLASGGAMFTMWAFGTALGLLLPGVLDRTTAASLDYAGAIFFAILMVVLVKGSDAPRGPWLLSGAVAAAAVEVVSAPVALVLAVGAGAFWALFGPGSRQSEDGDG